MLECGTPKYPWRASTDGTLHATGNRPCSEMTVGGRTCESCAALRFKPSLAGTGQAGSTSHTPGIIERATRRPITKEPGLHDHLCSHAVLIARRDALVHDKGLGRLRVLTAGRKIAGLCRALSLHKRLLSAIVANDIPKLRQTCSIALRQGCSIAKLLDRVSRVIAGSYVPRGGYSDRDYDICTLVMRLGGPKLMFAVQHALGLPSRSDWYRKCFGTLPQLVACPNLAYLERALKHNLQQQIQAIQKCTQHC